MSGGDRMEARKEAFDRLHQLLPPTSSIALEGYEDFELVGSGGFGTVYQARQAELARTVALKILSTGIVSDETRARFDRERQAIGSLSGHPHIVTVYESGYMPHGAPYIAMEFMPSGSLAALLARRGALHWEEATSIAIKVAGALETAHRSGVLHRDIKPENILMSSYGEPKLADFGIASLQGGAQTTSGVITASLEHAAPELLDGHRATVASDVYGLGSTLFTLLAGRSPFGIEGEEGLTTLIARIATEPVPDLRPAGVPAAIADVIERSLAKSPTERFETAAAFGEALQAAQSAAGAAPTPLPVGPAVEGATPAPGADGSSATRARPRREIVGYQAPAPERSRWRSPVVLAGIAAVAIVAAAGIAFAFTRGEETAPSPVAEKGESGEKGDDSAEGKGSKEPRKADGKRGPRNRRSGGGGAGGVVSGGGGVYIPPSGGGGGGSTGGSGGSTSGGGGSGGGGSASGGGGGEPQEPPAQAAPGTMLYHCRKGDQHYMTTSYTAMKQHSQSGFGCVEQGDVYTSSGNPNTTGITLDDGSAWIFSKAGVRTEPQCNFAPLYHYSSSTESWYDRAQGGSHVGYVCV